MNESPAITTNPASPPDETPAVSTAEIIIESGTIPSETENGRLWGRIVLILLVVIVLANVPISQLGYSLLRSVPEPESVAIAEGMALQAGEGTIYLLHNHRLRPFSSVDVFDHFRARRGLRLQPVGDHVVSQFGHGPPIYRLVNCPDDPAVYALERGEKRPFAGPPPVDDRSPWDQVQTFSCQRLDELPTGLPIH